MMQKYPGMTMRKSKIGRKRGKRPIKFRRGRQATLSGEVVTDDVLDSSVITMKKRRRCRTA